MTLVSGNVPVRFMRIFEGFLGDKASNDSEVIENMDFQGFGCYVVGTLANKGNIII